jgi:hypothetical protein
MSPLTRYFPAGAEKIPANRLITMPTITEL